MRYEMVTKIGKLCRNTNPHTPNILSVGGMAGNGPLDKGRES